MRPWELDTTITTLGKALASAWGTGVSPVITLEASHRGASNWDECRIW
jgi:hypothetical protein